MFADKFAEAENSPFFREKSHTIPRVQVTMKLMQKQNNPDPSVLFFLSSDYYVNMENKNVQKISKTFKQLFFVFCLRDLKSLAKARRGYVQLFEEARRKASSNIDELIRSVLNFFFFFTIRFHKHKKEYKAQSIYQNILVFLRIRFCQF